MSDMGRILTAQGWFYVVTGLWPILHIKSFEAVSGPKTDKWLVRTLGLLIACSGIIFIHYPMNEAALTLAILNAVVLSSIDIYYVWKKVIWKTYLADALVEGGFILSYLVLK